MKKKYLFILLSFIGFSIDGSIRLVNLSGQILEEIEILSYQEQYNLSVEKYPAGIYFLQYIKESVVAGVEKVIIN